MRWSTGYYSSQSRILLILPATKYESHNLQSHWPALAASVVSGPCSSGSCRADSGPLKSTWSPPATGLWHGQQQVMLGGGGADWRRLCHARALHACHSSSRETPMPQQCKRWLAAVVMPKQKWKKQITWCIAEHHTHDKVTHWAKEEFRLHFFCTITTYNDTISQCLTDKHWFRNKDL